MSYFDKYNSKGLVYHAYNPRSKVLQYAFSFYPRTEMDYFYKRLNVAERTQYTSTISYNYKKQTQPPAPSEWHRKYTMTRDSQAETELLQKQADKLGMTVPAFQALTQRAMAKIRNYLNANPAKADTLRLELAYFFTKD